MSIFESLQKKRSDGYPKVREITAKEKFKSDRKDPNYDKPYSSLEKEY